MKTYIKIFATILALTMAGVTTYAGPSDSAAFALRAAKENAAKQQASEQTVALSKSAPKDCKDKKCCQKR